MNSLPVEEPPVLDEPMASRSTRSRLVGFAQVAGIIAFMAVAIMFSQERTEPVAAAGSSSTANTRLGAAPAAALVVKVLQPQVQTSSETFVTTGNVVVRNPVSLVSQVTGRIEYLAPELRVGGAFAANELLLRIDPQDFQLAVAQAQAEIDSAEANLALQRAQSEAAVANYALLNGSKAVPPLVAKLPQIQQGQAQLEGARARVQIARLNLARTELRLPFAGKVTRSSAEVGQLLSQGVAFGQVFALDAVETSVPIAPAALQRLQPIIGRSARVSDGVTEVSATVQRMSAELDEQTRFARLYLQLADDVMPPGSFVQVSFDGPALDNTLLLPIAAEQANGRIFTVSGSRLVAVEPTVHFRTASHLVVAAFDTAEGVVLGTVSGAREGLEVAVAASE